MNTQPSLRFRWRSKLGVAVGFFLAWGALNAFLAISAPLSLHRDGAAAIKVLVLISDTMETQLLGRSLADIAQSDPRLGSYLVTFMDTMCAQMMSFALLLVAVTWFALRRGEAWALWAATLVSLVAFVYMIPILIEFNRLGVAIDLTESMFFIPLPAILAAGAVGWLGLRAARIQGSFSTA